MTCDEIPEHLALFLDFLFLDEAVREVTGKNPDTPMRGRFKTYLQPSSRLRGKAGGRRGRAYMRRSDLSLRRYVAIEALRNEGVALKVACIEVGKRLGKETEKEIEVIKSGYQKFRPPYSSPELLSTWGCDFIWWREWLRRAPLSTVEFLAGRLKDTQGELSAYKFLSLAKRIRKWPPANEP